MRSRGRQIGVIGKGRRWSCGLVPEDTRSGGGDWRENQPACAAARAGAEKEDTFALDGAFVCGLITRHLERRKNL